MIEQFPVFTDVEVVMTLRLFAAAFLGALIGFEREYMGKAAGLRTYALVSVGACLFSLVSVFGVEHLPVLQGVDPDFFRYNYDASRIASNIVTGIGFLGAGLIILRGSRLEGLTTAAGLWVAAALGMAVGFGFYIVAIVTVVVVLAILLLLNRIELNAHESAQEEEQHDG